MLFQSIKNEEHSFPLVAVSYNEKLKQVFNQEGREMEEIFFFLHTIRIQIVTSDKDIPVYKLYTLFPGKQNRIAVE